MSKSPISDYALLSDCHSAALVNRNGSIDWLCLPRFDAPSVLGRLLDERAGHWRLSPVGEREVRRRYLERTMVLETTFTTATGSAKLVDAMAMGPGNRGHELGANAPHTLLRTVTCVDGEVDLELVFEARPEYGIVAPLLAPIDGGVVARGGAQTLCLSSPIPLELHDSAARARFRLHDREEALFALQHRSAIDAPPSVMTPQAIAAQLVDTIAAWQSWSEIHQTFTGPFSELVHHSGRVLQALTYQPTGAIVAAATTSLPESVGGERNWDYRFTWVRDACFTLSALWVAACPDEADRFFDFLAGAAMTQVRHGGELQIMFGIGGEHDLSERELPHLTGWRDSRPVRIGNGAWSQRQLDVYGELLSAVYLLQDKLGGVDATTRTFLADVADAAAARWRGQDQGIWEMRGEPRDFLYSKLMCWVALDRAIQLADLFDARDRVPRWQAERDLIAKAILERGWSDRVRAFTQSFGSDDLDASNLMMPIVGFLPADDPRMRSTIEVIAERLTDKNGLVYRYLAHDGLAGSEGTFLLCTFWLAEAFARAGDVDRARATFARACRFVNDVGLLAEEVEPTSGELLGNFPQAFSHIGLVNAAWAIAQAEARQGRQSFVEPLR